MKTKKTLLLPSGENQKRVLHLRVFCSIVIALLLFLPFSADCDQNTPNFGIGLSVANYPDCTADDYMNALWDLYQIGGHSGFIWHWDNAAALENRLVDIANIKLIGLKTFVQISLGMLGTPTPPEGYARSYADPDTRALYLDNVRQLAGTHPDYINLATEANFIAVWMPEEWEHYKTLYREAYDLIKTISPETQVGVSYHYGVFIWKLQFSLPYELGPHDYVAFTSYPEWLVTEGHYASIEDIPTEWYGIARRAFPDTPVLFSEIGWSSEGTGSPEEQNRFVQNLPRLMSEVQPDLITWVFIHDTNWFNPLWADLLDPRDRDLLEELGVNLPMLFTRFNGMGLKTINDTPKPVWESVLNLDFSVPQ